MNINKVQELTKKIEVLSKFNLNRTSVAIYLRNHEDEEMTNLLEEINVFYDKKATPLMNKLKDELTRESEIEGID